MSGRAHLIGRARVLLDGDAASGLLATAAAGLVRTLACAIDAARCSNAALAGQQDAADDDAMTPSRRRTWERRS